MHQPQYLAVKRVTIKAMLLYLFIRILHHASLGSRDVVFGGTANPGEASGWLIEGARAAYSTQLRGYFDWMRTGCVGK